MPIIQLTASLMILATTEAGRFRSSGFSAIAVMSLPAFLFIPKKEHYCPLDSLHPIGWSGLVKVTR